MTEEPRSKANWRGGFRLLLVLGWLLVMTGFGLVRGGPRPRRPSGEPESWKLWLWCALALLMFGLLASAMHWAPRNVSTRMTH